MGSSGPPPREKIKRMSAYRAKTQPNSKLTIVRVDSNGKSMIGGATPRRVHKDGCLRRLSSHRRE